MRETLSLSKHASNIFIYLAPLICFVILGATLQLTNPLDSGPVIILFVFVLLYLLVFSVLSAILNVVGAILRMIKPHQPPSLKRWYYVTSVLAIAPVLFVAINTLGQLEWLEVVLIVLFVALGCFYVLRRSAK